MVRSIVGLAVMAGTFFVLGGCSKQPGGTNASADGGTAPPPPPPIGAGQVAPPPAIASSGATLTEDEAREFASEFEDAAYALDSNALSRMIDWRTVAVEATRGTEAPEAMAKEFQDAFARQTEAGQSGLVISLLDEIGKGGSLTPINVFASKAQRGVRFRLITGAGALNYFDFTLARRPDGTIKAVDVFIYASGESVIQTARQFFLSAVAQENRGFLARLAGKEQALMKHLTTLQQMHEDLRAGRHQAVLSAYDGLPDELKRERVFLVPRYSAAAEVSEAQYAEALADFRRFYPNDPSAELIMIDVHVLQQDYDAALAAIDRLDRTIGGDPYLNVFRGNIWAELGNLPSAKEAMGRAIEAEPFMTEAYFALIGVTLLAEEHAETARLLDEVADRFDLEFTDLAGVEEYAKFVASPEYADWKARNAVASPAPGGLQPFPPFGGSGPGF
jgi:tetratricopeptide (TPR) repeat protein